MEKIYRFFAEKKDGFNVEANGLAKNLRDYLHIKGLKHVRIFNRYDIAGIEEQYCDAAGKLILSEPQCDFLYREFLPPFEGIYRTLAIEYLPGQYDQRADSAAQCIQVVSDGVRPSVKSAKVYVFFGEITDREFETIKSYLINPVESRQAAEEKPLSLADQLTDPEEVFALEGFMDADKESIQQYINQYSLAMDVDDLLFMQNYFATEEKRNPTITELKMIDTYWSDHCRHTTFMTEIAQIEIEDAQIQKTYQQYLAAREEVYGEKAKTRPITMMDMGTIAGKVLKKRGILRDLDESEEINACSVKVDIQTNKGPEPWLFMFKNETHNHPTEIEPFGGAATCLGGAIRDPLSGRSYVYQAMRVTGAADPRVGLEDTIEGKLPQKRITTLAAKGYSSYGNQIGLATGLVDELYHPGYAAKRMEIGAVLGAAPAQNVVRETPAAEDIVILLGGRTGRDGCGGATGSSKSHTVDSLATCGAEVQKGNPVEERKIQRLFRNAEISKLIKRCNDFGAGGVSVAIGELADGLCIDLDQVPKKYEGLNGTELAISESQERMAVVIAPENKDQFIAAAKAENLEATVVAHVTASPRLVMNYRGNKIVDISRDFLNSAGAKKKTAVKIAQQTQDVIINKTENIAQRWKNLAKDLNVCSKKGLMENFDSSIGASTVLMPFGGKYQSTPIQTMSAKLPILNNETQTASLMSYGFDPYLSAQSPYQGAIYAVTESLAKIVAAGGDLSKVWLSFQEYFPSLRGDATRWAMPVSALLGALKAQLGFGVAAIGGKDSMSGSFMDLDVPPTLVSFAAGVQNTNHILTPELKAAGNKIYFLAIPKDEDGLPQFEAAKEQWANFSALAQSGKVFSAWALSRGGIAEGLMKMAFGNRIGIKIKDTVAMDMLFEKLYGGIIFEATEELEHAVEIGETIAQAEIHCCGTVISLEELQHDWENTLEDVFPTKTSDCGKVETISYHAKNTYRAVSSIAKPKVVIPVFPGTNCEYDTARQVTLAGGNAEIVVIANLTANMLEDSIARLHKALQDAQIMVLPGGFSFGDEPEGSGKYIAAFLRHPQLMEDIHKLLQQKDGLMLGICNGFQALIKLGLVPYGKIVETDAHCPTLTFNQIGRHQSKYVSTRICSNKSPWLSMVNVGDIHSIPISHGEGRFVCETPLLQKLIENGQVATQYVDPLGVPSMDIQYNPNGSVMAIEGILSPDGRVLGKMGHSERIGQNVGKNISGNKDQHIFLSGIRYYQ